MPRPAPRLRPTLVGRNHFQPENIAFSWKIIQDHLLAHRGERFDETTGHSLRLKVIAEGVEFTDQASSLKRHSGDQMQGYLINAPIPAAEFGAILAAGEVRAVEGM
jgi:hypothetical protein